MKLIPHWSLALLCSWTLGINSLGASKTPEAGHVVAKSKIENRDQLLAAINAWLKEHHQTQWSMDELIGRAFDQAYTVYLNSNDSPLDRPVEAFLIELVENQPFTHEIRPRTNWRGEIKLHTARGEIGRQRAAWEQVIKKERDWSTVGGKTSETPRRLSLPQHRTLSLDIIATPAEIRDKRENPAKLTRWCIYLASALKAETPTRISEIVDDNSSIFVATPKELLDAVNDWNRLTHQPAMNLDDLTVRIADEAFSLAEAKREVWQHLELFLECLAKNTRFVYPMRVMTEGPPKLDEPEQFTMLSANKVVSLPPRCTVYIEVLDLPWGAEDSEGGGLRIDWTKVILSNVLTRKLPAGAKDKQ